ncbi:MAG: phosphoribosylanthranilate isomerase [Chthoniobacterales bacterium]
MSKPQIKVCGLTNTVDAHLCAALGVDMLGLNFSPQSLRCLDVKEAREIVSVVRADFPQVKLIGLFVDQPLDLVQGTISDLLLDGVQLHGNETPEFVHSVQAPFRIKALRVAPDFSLTNAYDCDAILLDTWSPDRLGGTGETFDWSIAAQLRDRVRRLILAGGLGPDNVSAAIRTVRPFAVDVCSGVEDAPGRKSETKLRRFIAAVRASESVETAA